MPIETRICNIEVAKLELKPGDTLALKTDLHLSIKQRDEVFEAAKRLVPEGVKIVMFASGLDYEVQKPDQS